ncbi:MAG: class F sortase [Candidatus Saccharimonadales bacterium]
MTKVKRLLGNKYLAITLIVLGIIGIGISILLYLYEPRAPKTTSSPTNISVNAAPSSVKPSPKAVLSYTVPPDDPKYIAIPAISISKTPILKLGLLESGAIATPNNIYDTGWYDASSRPGQTGAMFIFGHVSSWQANGVFYDLSKLTPGDDVVITRGDNKTYTYRVVSSKIYPYKNINMQEVLSPIDANKPGLNLMTCTGQVIKSTSEFNERLVVFTSLDSL